MHRSDVTLRSALGTAGYLGLGLVGTAVLLLGLLFVSQPVQVFVYDAFYLAVGPWSASTAATLLVVSTAILVAVSAVALVAEATTREFERLRPMAAGLATGIVVVPVLLAVATLLDLEGFLTALVAVGGFVVAVPFWLRNLGAWPAAVTAVAGSVPVVALTLLVLGFGLGWGGGYVVVAEEVPASEVDGSAEASFDEVPQLRDDLLSPGGDTAGWCEGDGRRTCYLELRGYDHEARAARFLADHGVRCPARNANGPRDPDAERSFVASDDGTYYSVSCRAYGD